MTQKKYSSKEREPQIASYQDLLEKLEQHVDFLFQVNQKFNEIESDVAKMEAYYFDEWLQDYNNFHIKDNHYNVLSQDHIHNAFQDIHNEKITLLKKIVSQLK